MLNQFLITIHKIISYFLYCLLGIITITLLILLFLYIQTNTLTVHSTNFSSNNLPASFDGYRIVQLSDLHSKNFGFKQSRLIHRIKSLHPNLIVITGDLIDGKNKNQQPCLDLVQALPDIAPTYYILGNHEASILYDDKANSFFNKVVNYGVTILYNECTTLTSTQNESINLIGLTDPVTIRKDQYAWDIYMSNNRVAKFLDIAFSTCSDSTRFNLLLSHRPEFLYTYSSYPIDLVLCGHVHGGQIRIPFIGGLYSSDQGYFPQYDAGYYTMMNTTMFISRGLGTGTFPIRLFNFPEIDLITLKSNLS